MTEPKNRVTSETRSCQPDPLGPGNSPQRPSTRMTQMTAVERQADSASPHSLSLMDGSIPMRAVPKVEVAPNGVVLNLRH